jgi:glucosylceramidase
MLSKNLRFFALILALSSSALALQAQSISVYRTNSAMTERFAEQPGFTFNTTAPSSNTALIIVNDKQRYQTIDGFGASLTDAAGWLFANKLTPAQLDQAFNSLFSRDGIALSFLRQPIGSSDLAYTFYTFDDLCEQSKTACTTPAGVTDPELKHFSLAHDEAYIIPQLKKALAINPSLHIMLSPWSPPGWMKTNGSVLGTKPGTKEPAHLKEEFYPAFSKYLVRTVLGYQSAGVPIYALSLQNEPLYAPENYSGMNMEAEDQAQIVGQYLEPALEDAGIGKAQGLKILAYDHNWDRPDYPKTFYINQRAAAAASGVAWHHYEGKPEAMTTFHDKHPNIDQWVTESSGGTWQSGNVFAEEATELINVMRNWSRSYILWALATDQNNGPIVGGCDKCRGIVTVDTSDPAHVVVRPELDYYVLGHASKFLFPDAVRIASNEPAGTKLRDVAFRNPDGTIVLYTLNPGTEPATVAIVFHSKSAITTIPASTVATFIWKP